MSTLNGKYAVVTGAGRGIGEAIVKRFLDDGVAGVAMLDYAYDVVAETAKKLDPSGERAIAVACDVSNPDQVHAAVDEVVKAFGRIDILVNNAGITRDAIFHKMVRSDWDAVLSVNLNGPYNMCREIVPMMRAQEYGRIVNISSVSANGSVGQANYAASKAGLIGFTKTLAREGGPKNIIVNAIAPGYIETDMLRAVPAERRATYTNIVPLRRLGDPSEIASIVSFLSSDDTSFMTGQCLTVSGGAQT